MENKSLALLKEQNTPSFERGGKERRMNRIEEVKRKSEKQWEPSMPVSFPSGVNGITLQAREEKRFTVTLLFYLFHDVYFMDV